jgi:hypothetical protein
MGLSRSARSFSAGVGELSFSGYTPNAYRMMLDREGAITTARKLGFARSRPKAYETMGTQASRSYGQISGPPRAMAEALR